MLLVVRHADAGDKRTWDGPDSLRPLSPTGHRQAEGLVIRLEDYPVERILCSPTLRCHQTVEPLARDHMLQIESVPVLGVDTTPAQLLALFWDLELRDSVLCTHGEGIGLLLTRLIADALLVEDPLDWPKGSTWLLERTDHRQVRGAVSSPHSCSAGSELPEPRRLRRGDGDDAVVPDVLVRLAPTSTGPAPVQPHSQQMRPGPGVGGRVVVTELAAGAATVARPSSL